LDRLRGSALSEYLVAGPGNDRVYGRGGADCLVGDGGHDLLNGGAGADVLLGGPGNDTLIGGPGADRLDCGPGRRDVARVDGADMVRGCERLIRARRA
jgi:Ca2+-binding RTX toxin-like protein